jgi:hypothetical protein
LTAAAVAGFLAMVGATSGCGESKTDNAPLDPEAQKINAGVQDGMKGFMQSKTQPKGKTSK